MAWAFFFTTVFCLSSLTRIMASSDLVQGNEKFGKTLYGIVAREEGNLICSPISAHMVLSMAAVGAAGDTKTALLTTLGIKDPMDAANGYESFLAGVDKINSNLTLNLANEIFVMKSFELKPEFSNVMKKNYHSAAQELDFAQNVQAANTINGWVDAKTNHKIKELIQADSLSADTRLVLVNAIYFKGNWAKQFKKENTHEESFYLLDGTETKCNMMHATGKYGYMEDENLKAKVLKMDYTDESVSMLLFLPHERDGLKHLEDNIHTFDFQNYKRNLGNWEVELSLPKFTIKTEIKMTDILKKMGLEVMFSDNANFSNIAKNGEQLKVSEVIQKAFIEVNEQGAEAAAATGVKFALLSMPMAVQRYSFKADHPYLVVLTMNGSEGSSILFMGRITNPAAS